jgi:hypothetical protein
MVEIPWKMYDGKDQTGRQGADLAVQKRPSQDKPEYPCDRQVSEHLGPNPKTDI